MNSSGRHPPHLALSPFRWWLMICKSQCWRTWETSRHRTSLESKCAAFTRDANSSFSIRGTSTYQGGLISHWRPNLWTKFLWSLVPTFPKFSSSSNRPLNAIKGWKAMTTLTLEYQGLSDSSPTVQSTQMIWMPKVYPKTVHLDLTILIFICASWIMKLLVTN